MALSCVVVVMVIGGWTKTKRRNNIWQEDRDGVGFIVESVHCGVNEEVK